nr:hypothetical protein [uncultured archaeon]
MPKRESRLDRDVSAGIRDGESECLMVHDRDVQVGRDIGIPGNESAPGRANRSRQCDDSYHDQNKPDFSHTDLLDGG